MNQLIDYLLKHHNPDGNANQHVRIDDVIDETDWTRKEIMEMALEAREHKYVTMTMKTGYRIGEYDKEGLDLIGVWNEGYRKMRRKS